MIGFITDWGLKSHYVGVAKAVIKRINPAAEIIDITHEIEPFNVRKAAHVLYRASLDFPPFTVFLVVVDYGVGTARKAIVMKTKNDLFFVAPDNGVLTVVAEEYGVSEIREIENKELFYRKEPSFTFHGRDIFAPVAAHLDMGLPMEKVGERLLSYEALKMKKPTLEEDRVVGEVAVVDTFGNVSTNVPFEMFMKLEVDFDDVVKVRVKGKEHGATVARAFGDVGIGELLVHPDSAGFLEVAMNMGYASKVLSVKEGDEMEICR
ncbi:S-adenosyl-l-methionine hydroxide adenosyltransferase family protein [Thermotoga sp.]|uniref:SAM hydrolase/SAM-dependent halogenase family protein n=1 Tax=Thermotoga sp. TaxID=28240 RepID=UPI0025D59960|nr:S-adenosyl-l-methionine hydroxide adenosyltransferase family protein [Thermotoga sp.]MCD6551850.1 S-adenosyl-l-methionine hydroxide adenosyltransferase family protein [Thermotoga sp.]